VEETGSVAATSDILPNIAARNGGVRKGSWCIVSFAIVEEVCRVEIV
jgi:hypothetical protein